MDNEGCLKAIVQIVVAFLVLLLVTWVGQSVILALFAKQVAFWPLFGAFWLVSVLAKLFS